MKAYFVASIIGRSDKMREWQEKIVDIIRESGVEIDAANLETEKKKLFHETEEDMLKAFTRNSKSINGSDVVIAEVSVSDSGVGYEIAYALSLRKPVLALYNEDAEEPTAPPIQVGKQKLLSFQKYNQKTLKNIIDKFFIDIKYKLDTKFILIISPEIDRYLEWAAEQKRMHKAQIVRNAVEKEMENDKEYKTYSESIQN